jgi:hypothetical protein
MRRVIGEREIGRGKWLKLLEVDYETENGIHQWEMTERTTKKSKSDGKPQINVRFRFTFRC